MAVKRFVTSRGAQRIKDVLHKEGFDAHMNVRLADVFFTEEKIWTPGERGFIFKSSFDFLIVDSRGYPQAALEYDSDYHNDSSQKRRDALKDSICRKAEFPLLRFRDKHLVSVEAILQLELGLYQQPKLLRPVLRQLAGDYLRYAASEMETEGLEAIPIPSITEVAAIYDRLNRDYQATSNCLKAVFYGRVVLNGLSAMGLSDDEAKNMLTEWLVEALLKQGKSDAEIKAWVSEIEAIRNKQSKTTDQAKAKGH